MRLSPKKLSTISNREQYILLARKWHTWLEEINMLILIVEESGILTVFADNSPRVDLSINHNEEEALKNIDDKALDLATITHMMTILLIGLPLSALIFITEFLSNHIHCRHYVIDKKLPSKVKFRVANIICCIVQIVFAWMYFYEEKQFPAVIAFIKSDIRLTKMRYISLVGMALNGQQKTSGAQIRWR